MAMTGVPGTRPARRLDPFAGGIGSSSLVPQLGIVPQAHLDRAQLPRYGRAMTTSVQFGARTAPRRTRPLVMGVLNITPDSFSDGGRFLDPGAAVAHGVELVAQGADLLDLGGESTRPGAEPVAEAEELRRVLPVLRLL